MSSDKWQWSATTPESKSKFLENVWDAINANKSLTFSTIQMQENDDSSNTFSIQKYLC